MFFMSKHVSRPKISSILQKMKIGQNSIYALFARSPSIILTAALLHCINFTFNAQKVLASYLKILAAKCWRSYNWKSSIHCRSNNNKYRVGYRELNGATSRLNGLLNFSFLLLVIRLNVLHL